MPDSHEFIAAKSGPPDGDEAAIGGPPACQLNRP
ncbi:hypothetical protein ACVWZD_005402 [Streptomyces sp. TE3672]